MRTVLIPTDFSANAMNAIEYALNLYKNERTDFFILHAYADEAYETFNKDNGSLSFKEHTATIEKNVDASLNELIGKISKSRSNPKHSFKSLMAFESLVDAVNDFVDKKNIDLVIMGTQGKTGNKKITFGSYTVQVFKYVRCPVLAIPGDYAFQKPKKILFPTDYMMPYKRRELKLLNTLAADFKSEIFCLYISDFEILSNRQVDNKRFLQEELSKAYLFFETTPDGNKAETIVENIVQKEIDLLVMINARYSFLESLLYQSTVDQIALHPKVPFLVMQNLPR